MVGELVIEGCGIETSRERIAVHVIEVRRRRGRQVTLPVDFLCGRDFAWRVARDVIAGGDDWMAQGKRREANVAEIRDCDHDRILTIEVGVR